MIDLIRNDIQAIILQYGKKNIKAALIITAVSVLITAGCAILKKISTASKSKEKTGNFPGKKESHMILRGIGWLGWHALFFMFSYYACFLAELTIFTREAGSRTDVNLHFFETWHPDVYSQCFMIENVLLFFPFGAFLVLLWKRAGKIWKILVLSFFLSMAIEITQLRTGRGYFQVDDIWLNMLGGLLGGDFGLLLREIWNLLAWPFRRDKAQV